ncbi:MAG: alanine--tRNA ligase [Defluviitaleaceae bacterium]|nr:alanine--tRNA ligase [Defluviitaleaceae bacterium]
MKYQTVNQIRDAFLDFFVGKGHYVLPSYPLVPQGDKSLLLINSGMAPMKSFFTGQEIPPSPRIATCQKCIRTTDIDEVGKDARHASFFEMLGNFSFGDYFKKEVIPWAWEFMTKVMEIPAEKLSVSVYLEDDEAYAIWRDDIGLSEDKIFRMGKEDNYWEHGIGPCGPCSEIYFDRGAEHGCGDPGCTTGCECDRFMEVWNLVFTQFEKSEDGSYSPLASTNIDTGMGLERLAIVMQNAPSIFDIDNIKSVRDSVLTAAGVPATGNALISANIVADHVRSVTFMAADGVLPSNEGRGYAFRRLLRRAVRHGKAIGLTRFVQSVAQTAIDAYSHAYPNLTEKSGHILKTLGAEENRFLETLDTGMNLLQKHIDDMKNSGEKMLSGADAFKLYDTFGFPPDLTREILEDNELAMDSEGFESEMSAQKTRAREARGTFTYMGADETVYHKLPPNLPTEFVGYTEVSCEAEILALICDGEIVNEVTEGKEFAVVLNKTPFYAASGGQKGDKGWLRINKETAPVQINDCITVAGNNTVHIGSIESGSIKVGQIVKAVIFFDTRAKTSCNHTATHLLQEALRRTLGDHVEQAGSSVDAERLRFDFTHMQALTPEERENVEKNICSWISSDLRVVTEETTPEEARKKGALALFGEKYGDTVRMVSVGDNAKGEALSVELCGGTHVKSTGLIGAFRILSESGIASGVRRIEAVTNLAAINSYKDEVCAQAEKIKTLSDENRALKKEIAKTQAAAAGAAHEQILADILKSAETHGNFTLVSAKPQNCDIDALRKLCDKIKAEIKSGALILCGVNNETGAVQFLASATDDAVKAGINCGQIVKNAAQICGGGGGGKPNHAQAGGKDAAKADEALAQATAQMKEMLG